MAKVRLVEKKGMVALSNGWAEVSLDLEEGTWSAKNLKTGTVIIDNAHFRVDKAGVSIWPDPGTRISWKEHVSETVFGRGTTLTVTYKPSQGYEPIRMITFRMYPERPFIELGWGVRNRFHYPVKIKDVELLFATEMLHGERLDRIQVLKSGAGAEPNLVEKGWDTEAHNGAMLTFLMRGVRHTLVAGGLSYSEFARRIVLQEGQPRWIHKAGRTQRRGTGRGMELACWDPQGKLIAPGKTYMSPDTSYIDLVTQDPFEALEAYGEALRLANNAEPKAYDFPTLCGWMVSTNHLGEGNPINNSPGLVEQTRIARERGFMKYSPLAVRLEPDTYCYDNCGETQQGWWDDEHWGMYGPGRGHKPDPSKASLRKPYDTFAKFCKAVTELGGIPFTYFQCSMPSNDFAVAHPEWMLGADLSRLHVHHAHHRPHVRYDYTHPGFQAHCLKVWKRLRKGGLKGVKFDYPETAWAKDGGFYNNSFTTTAAYCELYRLCREGLGDDAYIHERILGGHTHESVPRLDATAGIVDLQRVWGDASHFEPEMASRIGLRWYKSRSVFLYYPDGKSFYNKGKPLPAYQRRAFLTLIAFLSGRLEIGTSIGSMTDEMFHDTTRLYPMLGGTKSPRPVDMLSGKKHPEAYVYSVTDDWHQVLLVNNNKRGAKTVSVPLSGDMIAEGALGLDPKASYHAFDFWSQSYIGKLKGTGKLSMKLRGGEVAMISVRRVMARPQLISTNRHIMQGMMECHGVKWDSRRKILSGSVDVVGGEQFKLTIACNGKTPKTCRGAEIMKRRGGLVELAFESKTNKRMRFELRC